MPNKIILDGDPGIIREDLKAGATITPGQLIAQVADNDLEPHGTAGDNAEKIFALPPVGVEPAAGTKQIDQTYAAGASVRALFARRGTRLYAWLKTGNNVAAGQPLESGGAGNLQLHTAPSQAVDEGGVATYTIAQKVDAIVAYAEEDLNNASGSDQRILVRVA